MAAKLSVNVNKVATLRNSRGGRIPDLCRAVEEIIAAGAPGITVHPRADERHIRRQDVLDLARLLSDRRDRIEFNIEGDPRPDLMDLVCEVRPHQCTLVPVRPGERTSEAGWDPRSGAGLGDVVARLSAASVRVSLFVDAEEAPIRWARELGVERVELYTEPFACAFTQSRQAGQESFARYVAAAELAHSLGLGVNAGHDLDLDNLTTFRTLPHFAEASIGHGLVSHALYVGLRQAVQDYLAALEDPGT